MTTKMVFYLICTLFLLGCQNLAVSKPDTLLPTDAPSPTPVPTAMPEKITNAGMVNPLPAIGGGGADGLAVQCEIPAGWIPYQMQVNETVHSIAWRAGLTGEALLAGNCQTDATTYRVGSWLYVPPAAANAPNMLLPLGIISIAADPMIVTAGDIVTLYWQSQGPVVNVRVGWVYQGQFTEAATGLPAGGAVQLVVPDDGRESYTLMVLANDGVREVVAQTSIQVRCTEGWFFAPAPSGCPLPSLITTFVEQSYQGGAMVYIPALDVVYVFADGQPGYRLTNAFRPGMPPDDPGLIAQIPAGLRQPSGTFHYAWRSDDTLQSALGWATRDPLRYRGILQQIGDTVYLSTGGGYVYYFGADNTWAIIQPE